MSSYYMYYSYDCNCWIGLYRGIAPGVMGSLATGATYFGVIESTKNWMDETHPGVGGHWAHFLAGAIGIF